MFNKGQLADILKHAQEMQSNIAKVQQELEQTIVVGHSASGGVQVHMTCKHQVRRVEIAPPLLSEDKEMLEDLIAAAFNAALVKAEEISAQKLGKVTAGMPGLPAGMKLPF